MGVAKKGYLGFVRGENFLRHFFLLAIRLYWGALLVATGFGKWIHAKGVIEYFSSLGIPYPGVATYLVGAIEFFGGISLILGLFSRLFSFLLILVFIGAYATAHHESVMQLFSKPSEFTSQSPFLFLFTAFVVFCFGSGLFSFDYWLEKRAFGKAL